MQNQLDRFEDVERCVGKLSGPRDLKVIDFLDLHAINWLQQSPIGFLAFTQTAQTPMMRIVGQRPTCVDMIDAQHIALSQHCIDQPIDISIGQPFGSLFLVPHIDETLRLNGYVSAVNATKIILKIEECFLHCAKALMRSQFWHAAQTSSHHNAVFHQTTDFLQHSDFMLLATCNRHLQTDVSPKGDPAGMLIRQCDTAYCFADRPGNRRVDSFRNILEQPLVTIMAMCCGSAQVCMIQGRAGLNADPELMSAFEVQGKRPHLVTAISPVSVQLISNPILEKLQLWRDFPDSHGIDPAEIFKAHIKLNKSKGLAAKLTRTAVSIPGLLKKGLEKDYKDNLY